VPEYLRLRFDEKTRGLNAFLSRDDGVSFGIIMYFAMAKLILICTSSTRRSHDGTTHYVDIPISLW